MADLEKGQVLQRLASIDPLQLCFEARQGVRDPAGGGSLYRQCIAAKLLTQHGGAAVGKGYGAEEAACLHSLFDVALENGLAALVSHYVTEVCMDASVVSSDAIETKLLDGSIVQSWTEGTLRRLLCKLKDIYTGTASHSENQSAALSGIKGQLRGLSHVLDALEGSIADGDSSLGPAQKQLQDLKETLLKALQHSEVFSWCLQQRWLEHHRPQDSDASAWVAAFHRRKEAAANRHWPPGADPDIDANGGGHSPASDTPDDEEERTLFVEEALDHLGLAERSEESESASWLSSLAQDGELGLGVSGMDTEGGQDAQLYPPPSVRGAVDLLFLRGWASEFLAKKAIFLYYLYDRFWGSSPGDTWQAVVSDYCSSFHLPAFFRIECLVFFLLDNETPEALREACQLLPQIAGPKLHPRIPQVLLERGAPQDALNILRASGRLFTLSPSPRPLDEAITALRASLACGPLSEAYLLQHNHWAALRASLEVSSTQADPEEPLEDPPRDWREEMDVLVTEVVNFATRGGVLRELVELPWAPEEESPLENALVRRAERDPGGPAGSHLVVYYLLRCRYAEAMIRHRDVCRLEDTWQGADEVQRRRAMLARQQRASIVEACYHLLPEAQRLLLEHQLAHPEPQPMDLQHPQAAPLGPPPLPDSAPSLLFPLLPSRQAGPARKPPTKSTNAAASWQSERVPDGPSVAMERPKHPSEEGGTEEGTGDDAGGEDADFSPRPRRLLYDEVGGSGGADRGGENTPGTEDDEPMFHSPLGRFTPERGEPEEERAQSGAEAGENGLQNGTGFQNGVAADGRRLNGGVFSGRWDGGDSPSLAGGGPFMSPVSGAPQPRRGGQATPAARAVRNVRTARGSPGNEVGEFEFADGFGEEDTWADGRPGPPPRGTLSEDVDVADDVDDQPNAAYSTTPRFVSNGKTAGSYAQASPNFQLPDPPTTSNAGHTPAFLRNGGAMRWRTEEDLEDGCLDEAVASALTPGLKRPKSGHSTGRLDKVLRQERLL